MKKQILLIISFIICMINISVNAQSENQNSELILKKAIGTDIGNVDYLPNAGENMKWTYQALFSNEFDYAGAKTSTEFTNNWQDRFFNSWTGPGITRYSASQSSIEDGQLVFRAKVDGTVVRTGIVTTKSTVVYPMYMVVRAKISESALASAVWMLSDDSTEEIDNLEAFGEYARQWSSVRLHLSHHTFIRNPFADYQPTSDATWYVDGKGTQWARDYHEYGVLWTGPFSLSYYVDGVLVRTTPVNEIDPNNHLGGNGLTKPMHLIISAAAQAWRGIDYVNDASVNDAERSTFRIDWIRVYKPATISRVSSVNEDNKLSIYQEQSGSNIYIQSANYIQQVHLYRTDGHLVQSERIDGMSKTISTNNLSTGLYVLRAQMENGAFISEKFLKK